MHANRYKGTANSTLLPLHSKSSTYGNMEWMIGCCIIWNQMLMESNASAARGCIVHVGARWCCKTIE